MLAIISFFANILVLPSVSAISALSLRGKFQITGRPEDDLAVQFCVGVLVTYILGCRIAITYALKSIEE
jgi:hypothetical protein